MAAQGLTPCLIGIHLCKNLSARCVDLFNDFPHVLALVLAPCCLPDPSLKPLRCGACTVVPTTELYSFANPYDKVRRAAVGGLLLRLLR
jgi:hypothetical protein